MKPLSLLAAFLAAFALSSSTADAADKKTERLWKAKCSSCHGMDGKAETKKGKELEVESMATAEYQKKFSDAQLKKAILEGVSEVRNGKKKEMDPYKDELKDGEPEALVAYIRELAPAK
jgi:mono/diheme cytochrome c family protein